ncbi:MAG: hypothetical protein ABR589_09070 [Chthoniobacterales bacterium]
MRRNIGFVVAFLIVALSPASSWAETFVIPHIFERNGRVSNTPNTFDTVLYVTNTGGRAGVPNLGGANIDLYLYDFFGSPLTSASSGDTVCNPCSFVLPATKKKLNISIDKLITAAGGFFGPSFVFAWGAVVVTGAGAENISMESVTSKSNANPKDLSFWSFQPQRPGWAERSILPHIFERRGRVVTDLNTYDTQLFILNPGGHAGIQDQGNAEVALYLFKGNAALRSKNDAIVCGPCQFVIPSGQVNRVDIQGLIQTAGGFPAGGLGGLWGHIVVNGAPGDPSIFNVNIGGVTFNNHSSAGDLAFDGFLPNWFKTNTLVEWPAN